MPELEIKINKGRYELHYAQAICDSGRVLMHGRDFQQFRNDCFETLIYMTPELSIAFRSYIQRNNNNNK